MTRDEKHALIAERLDNVGPRYCYCASDDGGKSMALWETDAITRGDVEDFCRRNPRYTVHRMEVWPFYSSDLELCARAEAKIAGMHEPIQCRYTSRVARLILEERHGGAEWFQKTSEEEKEKWEVSHFDFMTAPAKIRVDAMADLIQSGALDK